MDLDVEVLRQTVNAWLVRTEVPDDSDTARLVTKEVWIPKSQVTDTDCLAAGDVGYMTITPWIAQQKGWM